VVNVTIDGTSVNGNGKTRVMAGTYRYNNEEELRNDKSETTLAKLQRLVDTNYFVLSNGVPVWHSMV
ncbi:MAG: hypothetical protein J6V66_03345, partial [Clostridia bacterium]|nr:hypothetical protein [Clostridia bacterium]